MKKILAILTALVVITLYNHQAFSSERELYGALLGTGGGAVAGHAIDGNPESVIIGSAIGGILGVSAAHIGHRGTYFGVSPYHGKHHNKYYRSSRYHRHFGANIRHFNSRDCRIIKYHTYKYGHRYIVKKRICRSDHDFGYRKYHRGHGGWGHGNWRNKHRW